MASPQSIRELRIKIGTTARTTFENAAVGSWDHANTSPEVMKLRAVSYDDSGLKQDGIEDVTLQQRFYSKPAPIPGLKTGTVKFGCYLGAANSSILASPEANVIGACWGGISLPMNTRSTTVAAGTSTTVNVLVSSANSYIVPGHAILIGTKGDARGNGQVYPVNAVATGSFGLALATSAAPTEGDAVWFSTTVYPQENATQSYIDTLSIGAQTAGVASSSDQIQTIGGQGKIKISGFGSGELPKFEMDLVPMDWQLAPTGSRASLAPQATSKGSNPPYGTGIGMFHIGDSSTSTRQILKAGEFSFDDGVSYQPVPDPSGVNGINGHQKMPGKATLEATILVDEDMPGLANDFLAGTGKRVILQMGHQNTKCAAIELSKAYVDDHPTTAALNNLSAIKVKVHADEPSATNNNLVDASWKLHLW